MQDRRSARIILLDPSGDVLLIRFEVSRQGGVFVFWAPPGGGVESEESDHDAARRELKEELGLDIPLSGPVHSHQDSFEHMGQTVSNTDVFFVGRCSRDAPQLAPLTQEEKQAMREMRWWASADIEHATDIVFPPDLSVVLRRL